MGLQSGSAKYGSKQLRIPSAESRLYTLLVRKPDFTAWIRASSQGSDSVARVVFSHFEAVILNS